mmetsp:Transcript_14809/g.43531  ORF Transcript_14809/g.43531 Transcript_14809/m.43531 type:complete len:216 (+) Transcript_14809:95-742(+)
MTNRIHRSSMTQSRAAYRPRGLSSSSTFRKQVAPRSVKDDARKLGRKEIHERTVDSWKTPCDSLLHTPTRAFSARTLQAQIRLQLRMPCPHSVGQSPSSPSFPCFFNPGFQTGHTKRVLALSTTWVRVHSFGMRTRMSLSCETLWIGFFPLWSISYGCLQSRGWRSFCRARYIGNQRRGRGTGGPITRCTSSTRRFLCLACDSGDQRHVVSRMSR